VVGAAAANGPASVEQHDWVGDWQGDTRVVPTVVHGPLHRCRRVPARLADSRGRIDGNHVGDATPNRHTYAWVSEAAAHRNVRALQALAENFLCDDFEDFPAESKLCMTDLIDAA